MTNPVAALVSLAQQQQQQQQLEQPQQQQQQHQWQQQQQVSSSDSQLALAQRLLAFHQQQGNLDPNDALSLVARAFPDGRNNERSSFHGSGGASDNSQ
jgi:hypothetical protein